MGNKIIEYIKNSNWWMGVLGNMLATMVGIALTVGIGYWNTYQDDRKMAREMMFNILRTAEESIPAMERIDSLKETERHAANKLWAYYRLRDIMTVPEDTLDYYFQQATIMYTYQFVKSTTDRYFFSAQMMHQFNNPELYTQFGEFVQFDAQTFEKLENLRRQAQAIQNTYRSKILIDGHLKDLDIIRELISNEKLTEYIASLETANTKSDVKAYKSYFENLLKSMGATREEYEEYVKGTDGKSNL